MRKKRIASHITLSSTANFPTTAGVCSVKLLSCGNLLEPNSDQFTISLVNADINAESVLKPVYLLLALDNLSSQIINNVE